MRDRQLPPRRQRIAYTEYGTGARTVVLIHGLLLSRRMHEPLARALAAHGDRVVTIDLLGHGRSDRPSEPARYSTTLFGLLAFTARGIPSRLRAFHGDVVLDIVRQEPGPSSAVLRGLFFGRGAPSPAERRAIAAPPPHRERRRRGVVTCPDGPAARSRAAH